MKSEPAFYLEQDKRGFLGEKQEPSCKQCVLHSGTTISRKQGERNPATSFCMISVPLANGLMRRTTANGALESSVRFLSGLQLASVYTSAVNIAVQQPHKQHALYMSSIPFQGVCYTFLLLVFGDCRVNTFIYAETCPLLQTRQLYCTRRALTRSEHCHFLHCVTS